MEIKLITDHKKDFLDLLLLADEQEDMINRYLEKGEMFALYDGDLKSIGVVVDNGDDVCELKNLATYPQYQGRGYAGKLVAYLSTHFGKMHRIMLVGTGDNARTLRFYKSCGFVPSHRIPNFFVDNYHHPMIEDGEQLVDMVYLKKELTS